MKPFHLPKNQHIVLPPSLSSLTTGDHRAKIDEVMAEPATAAVSYPHPRDSPLHFVDDVEIGEASAELPYRRSNAVPKSMRELAEDDLRRQTSEIAAPIEPDHRSSTPSRRKMRGRKEALKTKSGTNTPPARNSSVKRKNGKKRIREDSESGSEDGHRFDSAVSTRDGDSMTGTPNTTSGRVLRPRPQKKAKQS